MINYKTLIKQYKQLIFKANLYLYVGKTNWIAKTCLPMSYSVWIEGKAKQKIHIEMEW